jgi:hypothetical protein
MRTEIQQKKRNTIKGTALSEKYANFRGLSIDTQTIHLIFYVIFNNNSHKNCEQLSTLKNNQFIILKETRLSLRTLGPGFDSLDSVQVCNNNYFLLGACVSSWRSMTRRACKTSCRA